MKVYGNRRQDVSIKVSTNGTTYDRYDPVRGLHKVEG